MFFTKTTTVASLPGSRGPLPSLKYPPTPPMKGIGDVVDNLHSAAYVLTCSYKWNADQCRDAIRVAETYITMAKEKLEKL